MMKYNLIALVCTICFLAASCATAAPAAMSSDDATPDTTTKAIKKNNLALGADISSSGHTMYFTAENAVDGDVLTYFEGAANAYPNLLTVNLGRPQNVGEMKIHLNPRRLWQDRKQTIEVLTSDNGNDYSTAVASAEYQFSSEDNQNTATIEVNKKAQYIRLSFTANTEATGAQVAEWEIFPAK